MSLIEKWKKRYEEKKAKKYQKGLKKSSLVFSKEIQKISKKHKIYSKEYLNELEELLVASDMGIKTTTEIINKLSKKSKNTDSIDEINDKLVEIIIDSYKKGNWNSKLNIKDGRLNIILMVGVNGTGKTTTAAKLCKILSDQNKKVLLVAADTFRAGATEQLDEWAKILHVDIVKAKKEKQDPASLVYEGLEKAKNEKYDCVIIDTAGRLQNKINLMNELTKINNIIKRYVHNAPHETLLVLDAITGQNGMNQAKIFSENINITGVVLTKMDGSAKGGICLAIKNNLNIPVKYIGLGEQPDDLEEFDIDSYVYGLAAPAFMSKE